MTMVTLRLLIGVVSSLLTSFFFDLPAEGVLDGYLRILRTLFLMTESSLLRGVTCLTIGAFLFNSSSTSLLSNESFRYEKSWIKRPQLPLPAGMGFSFLCLCSNLPICKFGLKLSKCRFFKFCNFMSSKLNSSSKKLLVFRPLDVSYSFWAVLFTWVDLLLSWKAFGLWISGKIVQSWADLPFDTGLLYCLFSESTIGDLLKLGLC